MRNRFLQFLGLVKRSGHLVEGYNRCEEILNKRKIHLFIFSVDVSERTKHKFSKYCEEHNIPIIDIFSKEELGLSLGRPEINVLAVTNLNMAKKLLSHYENIN